MTINAGIGSIHVSAGNLKLQLAMDDLKEFIERFGIDALTNALKQNTPATSPSPKP